MQEMLKKVITDILTTLYEPFWFALLSALLLTIAYMYCYEPDGAGKGFKPMMSAWEIQERCTFSGIVLLVLVHSDDIVQDTS